MFDEVHLGWLDSDDYRWSAAHSRTAISQINVTTCDEVTTRQEEAASDSHQVVARELLGVYEPDRMRLPDRIRDGRHEDDNPPGVPWRRGQR